VFIVVTSAKGTQVVADINVQSVAPAQGRQNQAQWMITADVPWSNYPERFWVDAVAGTQPIAPGNHHCAFSIGNQKPNTTGDASFHYRFLLQVVDYVGGAYPDVMSVQFNSFGQANAPANSPANAPAGNSGSAPAISRDKSIVRQSSIKAVVDAKVAAYSNATRLVAEGHIIPDEGMELTDLVSHTADVMFAHMFYGIGMWVDYLENIVNDLQAPEEPEEPAEPAEPAEAAPVQQPIFEENV
jgi:hypothetical protein